jgi:hypothetical protein
MPQAKGKPDEPKFLELNELLFSELDKVTTNKERP